MAIKARRGRQGLPGHVRLTIIGPAGTWTTRVAGISTGTLAARMRAGESIDALGYDYMLTREWIEDAIRWELIPRRSRMRLVEALIEVGR